METLDKTAPTANTEVAMQSASEEDKLTIKSGHSQESQDEVSLGSFSYVSTDSISSKTQKLLERANAYKSTRREIATRNSLRSSNKNSDNGSTSVEGPAVSNQPVLNRTESDVPEKRPQFDSIESAFANLKDRTKRLEYRKSRSLTLESSKSFPSYELDSRLKGKAVNRLLLSKQKSFDNEVVLEHESVDLGLPYVEQSNEVETPTVTL